MKHRHQATPTKRVSHGTEPAGTYSAIEPAEKVVGHMERHVGVAPVVRCPGCNQPMEPKECTPVTDRLVDIRYVCAVCGMETKRTVREQE